MQWEYLVVRGENLNYKFTPRFLNDQELPNWKKQSLPMLLNQLGSERWELVTSPGYTRGADVTELLFKRPKP